MTRCSECPGVNNCVPGDGPVDADVLFIGEAPGKDENKKLRVFIGKTGDEVNRHYLPLAGLRRDNCRFTNAIRCLPVSSGGKLDPTRAKDISLLESCAARHLYQEVERHPPKVIVPMGPFACRAIFGESYDLEVRHGYPADTPWGIPAFPMFHPGLGIHEPKRMLLIRNDWQRLAQFLKGKLKVVEDPYDEPNYQEADAADIRALQRDLPIGCDTESTRKAEPYCFTYSQSPGTGRLIPAKRLDLLELLQHQMDRWEAPVLFHNWLYDWNVVDTMGLRLPRQHVVDTMARVFHLGNLPQGLKALSWRELGMTMQDFDDLVTPYSRANVLFYYRMAASHDYPKPPEETVQDSKTGQWKMYKPQSMSTKFKRFFTDLDKDPEKDVFTMWDKNWVNQQTMIEEMVGQPYPGKCITHVPFEKVLFYACRDSDALLRLWKVIRRMQANVRHKSQEHWRAA